MKLKILAAGDFHGKVPRFLRKVIQKEKPDVLISPGDFCSFLERKIWFKYSYANFDSLKDIVGNKKYLSFIRQNKTNGEKVISYIKSLKIPLFVTTGNIDYTHHTEIGESYTQRTGYRYGKPLTTNFLKKLKIPILDYASKKFKGYNLIGYPRSTYPGITRKHMMKKPFFKDKKAAAKRIKDYKKHWQRMSKLFSGKKNVIFIPHNPPYRTKLDKIRDKKADKRVLGMHYGSYLTKELIRKYQPRLCICGHMHENQGKQKLGRTWIVNCGDGARGQYAIIELDSRKTKIRLFK